MDKLIIHLVHPIYDESAAGNLRRSIHIYMRDVVPQAKVVDDDGDIVVETLQGTRYYIPRENIALVEMPMLHAAHADSTEPQGGTNAEAT